VSAESGRLENLPVDAVHLGVALFVLAVLLLYSPLFVQPPGGTFTVLEVVVLFLLYAMILVGLNLQFGHAGLVNFGPVAFFAVGGYTAAMLTAEDPFGAVGLGLAWPVGIVTAVLAAAALGVVLGVSTLRLRDDFLAIVTLAVAEIIYDLIIAFRDYTGGSLGLNNVPRPIAGTTSAGDGAVLVSTIIVFGALAVLFYGVFRRLSASPYGRVLRAIRADEQVTETLGKRVFRYKLAVFVYGAAARARGDGDRPRDVVEAEPPAGDLALGFNQTVDDLCHGERDDRQYEQQRAKNRHRSDALQYYCFDHMRELCRERNKSSLFSSK